MTSPTRTLSPAVQPASGAKGCGRASDAHVGAIPIGRLNPLAAVADQAWLSLISFSVSLAFIWGASKDEYGYYLLLLAPLALVLSIQNALVNSPLATFLPAATDNTHKADLRRTAVSLHVYLAFGCSTLGGIGLLTYGKAAALHVDVVLLVGFMLAISGSIARESQRSFAYVQGRGLRALAGDLIYGVVVLSGVALALAGNRVSAGLVLLLTGVAGVLPLLSRTAGFTGLKTESKSLRQFWSCGRWALPSVVVTWISLSSYPYFAEHALGITAVADIGAARLFLMPIGLVIAAWSNWYRPRISGWLAAGDARAVARLSYRSLLLGLGILALIAVSLVFGYSMIEPILGEQYLGLRSLVLMWLLFFAISLVRNIFMATLMTDAPGYKVLHHITWIALLLSVPGLALLSQNGSLWVVGVLCTVEFAQGVMVAVKARRYWHRAGNLAR